MADVRISGDRNMTLTVLIGEESHEFKKWDAQWYAVEDLIVIRWRGLTETRLSIVMFDYADVVDPVGLGSAGEVLAYINELV